MGYFSFWLDFLQTYPNIPTVKIENLSAVHSASGEKSDFR